MLIMSIWQLLKNIYEDWDASYFVGDEINWMKIKGSDGNDSILYKIVSEDGNTFKYDDGAFYPSTVDLVIKKI